MSNLDTRLRETLDRVAESTKVNRRFDEIVMVRQRGKMPRLVTGIAAFIAVLSIFVFPLLLRGDPEAEVAGDLAAPTGAGVTIDPSWLTVEDDDLAVFEALTEAAAAVHGSGWRTPLRTEAVWCLHEGGPGADTRASGFPIEDDLTVEALILECTTGNDSASLETTPETFTVCRGVFSKTEYELWLGSDEHRLIGGDVDGPHPGFPVVLGWQSDCRSEVLDTTNEVVLTDDLALDQINHARELEIAATGASHNNCFDYEEASALADEAARMLEASWLRVELTAVDRSLAESCYQPVFDLQWGAIYVIGRDGHLAAQEADTSTTLPPTTLPPG